MAGPYEEDIWTVGEAVVAGRPLIVRARSTLPSPPDREIHPHLLMVSWPYVGDESGMPSAAEQDAMIRFENAVDDAIDGNGAGVHAACLTGNDVREWRFYTADPDVFMNTLNAALVGHAAYPIEVHLYSDPEWTGLGNLLPPA